jgi:phosphopantothenoylcysteine decarboxylase / phosphopantothenate---cysteine ligase
MITAEPSIDVLLGVTGSVAAYKSAEIARLLIKRGQRVQALLTPRALRFLGAETLSAITARPVQSRLFGAGPGELHVTLSQQSLKLLVAPATADTLARLAMGRANDLLTATALCFHGPVFVAPAMHPRMWEQPATQHNVQLLEARGVRFLGPVRGSVASGDVGWGRMLEPEQIVEQLLAEAAQDLRGKRILVTAGPTLEDIDPVRFIGNRSTGKMGFALAQRAAARGADVCLISGPVQLPTPLGVARRDVRSALQMQHALATELQTPTDAILMAAAVGDFRPQHAQTTKLKRDGGWTLALLENPDLIAGLADLPSAASVTRIAFAVETGSDAEILAHARTKLGKKRVHAVVANRADEAFARDDNRAHWVTAEEVRSLPTMSKSALADTILDSLIQRWQYVRP